MIFESEAGLLFFVNVDGCFLKFAQSGIAGSINSGSALGEEFLRVDR